MSGARRASSSIALRARSAAFGVITPGGALRAVSTANRRPVAAVSKIPAGHVSAVRCADPSVGEQQRQ